MSVLRTGIYTKKYTFEDVKGDEQTINLQPLLGAHFKKLMGVISTIPQRKKDECDEDFNKRFVESLNEETVGTLHELCVETLKRSVSDAEDNDVEMFVTSNFLDLFPAIIEANLRN